MSTVQFFYLVSPALATAHPEPSHLTYASYFAAARTILPKAPVLPFLQSLEAPQATDLCDICGFDTERDNLIVYCGSCNMGVHQTCYGISKVERIWYLRFPFPVIHYSELFLLSVLFNGRFF